MMRCPVVTNDVLPDTLALLPPIPREATQDSHTMNVSRSATPPGQCCDVRLFALLRLQPSGAVIIMSDDYSILEWTFLIGLGVYLLIGLIVAGQRFARRCRRVSSGGDPDIAQFFVEWLLWPAALLIDRPLW